jgi:hypothetical protein
LFHCICTIATKDDGDEAGMEAGWLLVTVSTAGAPASLRVHVWRRLRSLGALYLQQSVCLLPATDTTVRAVRRLVDRVRRDGGHARVLRLALTEPGEEAAVIEQFRQERAAEYAEVLERIPSLLAELDQERARGRVTYAEVEESEADLERFRSWLGRIQARDYFDTPDRSQAQAAVERCAAALAAFEAEALAAEAPDPSASHPVPRPASLHATPAAGAEGGS